MSSALTAHKGQPLQACLQAAVFLCAGGHSTNARDQAAAKQVHGERRTGNRSTANARDQAAAKQVHGERRTVKECIMKSTSKRVEWIDAAKGLAILFIVCGHCADKNGADRILLHFSMFTGVAVFFLLSGMTFCWKADAFIFFDRRPFCKLLRDLFRGLILPYIGWSVISISVYRLFGAAAVQTLGSDRSHFGLLENLAGMLYGNSGSGYMEWNRPLWFLTCLAVTELFWYALFLWGSNNVKKCGKVYLLIAAVCIGSAAWVLYSNIHGIQLCLPWEIETSLSILPFFGLGRFVRARILQCRDDFCRSHKETGYALAGVCAVLLWCLLLGVTDADFRADRFTQPWLFYPETALGVTAVLFLAIMVTCGAGKKISRILVYMGQRTLAILAMHKFAIMTERVLLAVLHINLSDEMEKLGVNPTVKLTGLILFEGLCGATVIGLCLVAERAMVKILPFLFGKGRADKKRIVKDTSDCI